MKNLFVCTTPFQVMTCIALNKGLVGNLVILDKFNDSQDLCRKVQESNVFQNVRLFDDSQMWSGSSKSWFILRLKTVNAYRNCKGLVEKFFPDIGEYTDIFVSSRQQVNRLICMYAAEWMPKIRIHYFDDGLGSYSKSITEVKKIDKLLRRLFIGNEAANFSYELLLYSPEMYQAYNGTEEKIKKITIDSIRRERLDDIFSVPSQEIPRGIIFDTIPSAEFYDEGVRIYDELVEEILRQGNVVIKQHPRNKIFKYKAKYMESINIPFEVLCNKTDYSSSCFYTSFSTAVFTPKLLYDQEPTIVFLYKILRRYRRDKAQNCDLLVECLRKIYKEPKKIITPSTFEEFQNVIKIDRSDNII